MLSFYKSDLLKWEKKNKINIPEEKGKEKTYYSVKSYSNFSTSIKSYPTKKNTGIQRFLVCSTTNYYFYHLGHQ